MQRGGSKKKHAVLYKRFLARVCFGHHTCSFLTFFALPLARKKSHPVWSVCSTMCLRTLSLPPPRGANEGFDGKMPTCATPCPAVSHVSCKLASFQALEPCLPWMIRKRQDFCCGTIGNRTWSVPLFLDPAQAAMMWVLAQPPSRFRTALPERAVWPARALYDVRIPTRPEYPPFR